MTFTGYNLILVRQALARAIDDVHNEIATCPDVDLYLDEINDLERDKAAYEGLLQRVDKALAKGVML
jgi:hypothetical protein